MNLIQKKRKILKKEKLVNQGTNALKDFLNGGKDNNPETPTPTDSTKTPTTPKEEVKNTVKDKAAGALKDLFGKKKKEE